MDRVSLKRRLRDILLCYLSDDGKDAWEMMSDGTYTKNDSRSDEALHAACFITGEELEPKTKWCMNRAKEIGTQAALMEYHQDV